VLVSSAATKTLEEAETTTEYIPPRGEPILAQKDDPVIIEPRQDGPVIIEPQETLEVAMKKRKPETVSIMKNIRCFLLLIII